jgi:type IV pilus assembly protein PilW
MRTYHPSPITHHKEEHGFTLVELMFGMGIAMVVVAAGYAVTESSQKASAVNDQTVQMQQNARLAMELLSRDFKMAGFGMSGTVGACSYGIVPADNTPGGNDTGPDSVSVVVPTTLSTLSAVATGPTTTIALQAGAVAALTADGFATGSTISVGGVFTANVNAIAGDTLTVNTTLSAPATFPIGTTVYWLRCVQYTIGTTTAACGGAARCLLRGGVAIADGIEDLQLAYACDGCKGATPDGQIDDQNGSNTFDTADFVSNSSWTSSPMTPDSFRLVRVTLVARQNNVDKDWTGTSASNFVAEDHNPASDTGYSASSYQQYRRRLFTRTVQVRNLGLTS